MDAKAAIELNPYNSQAYIELAYGLHAQDKLKEALAAAEEAVSLAPKYDRAHYILGLCYMDGGFREMSITAFETFLDLYWERPTFPGYREKAEEYLEELK
jgi:tetratricopeptide (TPR) repeat protein